MENFNKVLLLAFATFFSITHLVKSQNQQGFISLDCGLPSNKSPYVEPFTNLTYISDANFIQGGKTGNIQNLSEIDFTWKPYTILRYFPDGIRNCYSLNVTQDTKYLIRIVFIYGNYDGLNILPRFDLYLGPNLWTTIDFKNLGLGMMEEIIHITRSNILDICVVKTGTSTPLISAIELRPLPYDTYPTRVGSLKNLGHVYFSNSGKEIRYPNDVYDRIWFRDFLREWTQISTTLDIKDSSDGYAPPRDVISTAAIPTNAIIAMRNIQSTYNLSRISWQGDPCVPKQFSWVGLSCSVTDTSTPPRIITLDLSASGLTGAISPSIQNLSQLRELDLSNNNLTGEVPEFLAKMKSLMAINLSGNNLTGLVPQGLLEREKDGLKLNVDPKNRGSRKARSMGLVAIVVAVSCVVVIIIIVLVLIFVFRRRKTPKPQTRKVSVTRPSLEMKNRIFTFQEVKDMTNNFQVVLGKGGFGVVYQGFLNNEQVAVKVLSQSSTQGYKEFKTEVELLIRVHYVGLVSLIGYCDEGDDLALIYEFMENGNLKEHLSGERKDSVLSWSSRLKIAIESALGIEYLHIGCKPPIVHRDVKCTNILLSTTFEAKLADFGLSRSFLVGSETHISTNVAGTIGYLDPEYYQKNWLTEKSDVYSFGIVLLEIITGQHVIDQSREQSYIVEWAKSMLAKGDIEVIMDPNLHGEYDTSSSWKALELALLCVNPCSAERPNMTRVAHELNECLEIYKNLMKTRNQDPDSISSNGQGISFISDTPTAR